MGFFGFGNKVQAEEAAGEIYSFSTPFMKIKEGNLALPFVDKFTTKSAGAIYFGVDNLFPQKLDQYYYTSPMHGAIIDFKKNATIGGGYDLTPKSEDMDTLIEVNVFKNVVKLDKLIEKLCMADLIHYRGYLLIKFTKTKRGLKPESSQWVEPSKVRTNQSKTHVYISSDWSRSMGVKPIPVFDPNCKELVQCLVYEIDTPGQDYYPIPRYASANNWIFLDGEESYLQKTNIVESIFPSFALFFPKKPTNKEEVEAVQTSVNKAKGAQNAGRIFTFFAGKKDEMPELTPIPKNNNDSLFEQTSARIDNKICQAHTFDPLLMGIRISGGLGNGLEWDKSYTVFEKNDIFPRRRRQEIFINTLIRLFGVPCEFKIKNYQIINNEIVEK